MDLTDESIIEYMQQHPHEYNLFKSRVERKLIVNNVSEYDLMEIFYSDKYSMGSDYYIGQLNDKDLLQTALNGNLDAIYHLGVRFLYLSNNIKDYRVFGLCLLFISKDYTKSSDRLEYEFEADTIKFASKIKSFEELFNYVQSIA